MEVEVELPTQSERPGASQQQREQLGGEGLYRETRYRWVVVLVSGISLLLNGLISHAVAPLAHKITIIYGISGQMVSISIIITFIVFFSANFPVARLIEKKGLRLSFCLGSLLYFLATGLYLLISQSYYFVILGGLLAGLSQPFLINSSAKIAAFWFYPSNRFFAIAILVAFNLIGLGLGFLLPTLVVDETATDLAARKSIEYLYLGYFILSGVSLVLSLSLMQSRPQVGPVEGAFQSKMSTLRQFFLFVRRDRNVGIFLMAYCVNFGSLITFVAHSNFLLKPYFYSDLQIALDILCLMGAGMVGSVLASFYLKSSLNYRRIVLTLVFGNLSALVMLAIEVNSIANSILTGGLCCLMGFFGAPVVSICYQLGCELAFPFGEAMVTGILNAGAFLWAFFSSSFISLVFGFGSQHSSTITMVVLSAFLFLSALSFFFVKINLKRTQFQRQQGREEEQREEPGKGDHEAILEQGKSSSKGYGELVEEQPNRDSLSDKPTHEQQTNA